jgi:hypothetical protein
MPTAIDVALRKLVYEGANCARRGTGSYSPKKLLGLQNRETEGREGGELVV